MVLPTASDWDESVTGADVEGIRGGGGVSDAGLCENRVACPLPQRQPAAVAAQAGAEQEVAVGVDEPPVVAATA